MSSPSPIQLTFNITNANNYSGGPRMTNIVLLLTSSVTINWGDGTSSSGYLQNWGGQALFSHTYPSLGIYNVTISGTSATAITRFGDYYGSYPSSYLQSVDSWGGFNITDLTGAFSALIEGTLNYVANIPPTVIRIDGIFQYSQGLSILDISNWDVSNVQIFSYAFQNCDYNANIAGWNTRSAVQLRSMFANNQTFNRPIGNWDTSKVAVIINVFYGAGSFNQNLANWSLKSVPNGTNMGNMFGGTAMDGTNISNTLYGWSQQTRIPQNIRIYLNSNVYYYTANGITGKNILSSSPYNWVIDGNGILPVLGNTPVITAVTPGANSLSVSFTQSSVGTPAPTYYYSFNGTDLCGNGVAASPIVIPNLIFDKSYTFYIIASNPAGNLASTSASGTPTTTPMQLVYQTPSSNQQIQLCLTSPNIQIKWGDGNIEYINQTGAYTANHTYSSAGTYTVRITGTLVGFGSTPNIVDVNTVNNLGNYYQYLTQVTSFGSIGLQSCNFANATNLTSVPNSIPTTLTNIDCLFYGCTSLNDANVSNWTTSNVTSMNFLFYQVSVFNRPLNSWNVANVTSMISMFSCYNATRGTFNQPIGNWDVGKVTNMSAMFWSTSFNQDISSWNVSNVTNMSYMFLGAGFNTPIPNWNVGKVVNMSGMFNGSYSLRFFNQNINGWNVSNAEDMSSMFRNNFDFNQPLGNWNVGKVKTMQNMFQSAISFNQYIGNWNVSNVTNFSYMFANERDRYSFNQNISGWNTQNATTMAAMFQCAYPFSQDLGSWNVSKCTDLSLMFNSTSITNVNLANWNVGKVTNMSGLFSSSSFNSPSIIVWDVSNVTNMANMFDGNSSFNQNIGSWNVRNVTNMTGMFQGASSFNQNLGSWNVTSLNSNYPNGGYGMFDNCGISTSNMNAILYAWSQQSVQSGVTIGCYNIYYSAPLGSQGYNRLVSTYGWMFPGLSLVTTGSAPVINSVTPSPNSLIVGFTQAPAGSPAPTYYYSFNGTDICGNGVSASPITIPDLTLSQSYVFYIISSNVAGIVVSDASSGKPLTSPLKLVYNIPSSNRQIHFFLTTPNIQIDWGDGNNELINQTGLISKYHTYSSAGTYTINIYGTLDGFGYTPGMYGTAQNIQYLTQVVSFGNLGMTYCNFTNASNLTSVPTSIPTSITNIYAMFADCGTFNSSNIVNWDTSNVTIMDYLFNAASSFNQPIGNWNVSNVTSMSHMFSSTFNQDLSNWNVGNVTNMSWMFYSNGTFDNINIGGWNVDKVKDMSWMFGATRFNGNIGNWNVSNVENMSAMFYNNRSFNQPIGNWNVVKVTTMSSTFHSATAFNQPIGNWNVSNVTDFSDMFSNEYGTYAFNQDIGRWNTGNGTTMNHMFQGAYPFAQDLSGWNVSNVTNMNYMFANTSITNENLANWNVVKVTNFSFMFAGTRYNSPSIANWNVSNATDMSYMFSENNTFNQDISSWNVSKVLYMSGMFQNATLFNRNIGNWNVIGLVNCNNMFDNCGLSASNMDSILYAWSQKSVKNGVAIGAQNIYYGGALGIQGRNTLVNTYGWTFPGLSLVSTGSAPVVNVVTPGINRLTVSFSQSNPGTPAPTYYYSFNGTDLCGNGVSSSPIVISNLTLAQNYTFYIIASNLGINIASAASSGKPNILGSAPVINRVDPSKNSLIVSFTGSMNGTPAPTYYYSLDGSSPLGTGVSSSPITITDLSMAKYYTFYIIASNSAGNVISDPSSAKPYVIGNAPVINAVDSSINSLVVSFSGSTGGYPAPTYYYSFNGTDPSGQGVASSPIKIPNLTLSQYYQVYIIATNSAGSIVSTSGSGKPFVTGSTPLIVGVTPELNSLSVSFAQLVLGNPLPTYYYSFNGTDPCGNGVSYSPIIIPNLTLSQYYSFYIISSNTVGNLVSDVSSGKPYLVGSAPVIYRVDSSKNSLIASFTQTNQGNPAPTYYYSFNGIDHSGQGVESSPITIPNLTQAQNYTFYILSSNSQGNVVSDSSSGQPYVINNRPVINRIDPSKNSLVVSFTGSANSNPAPTYYYSFNGTNPLGQGTSSSPITITDLSMAQYYPIYIIASNIAGSLVSDLSSAKPYVIGSKPVITNVDPSNNSLVVSFAQSNQGNPAPTYYYSFNGTDPSGQGVASSPITIPNITQSRTFYIIAANSAGNIVSDSSAGTPLVLGTAATLNAPLSGLNSLSISFTDASGFNPLHTNYYSINGGSYQYQVTSNPFVIGDLSFAVVYSISMKSVNSVGYRISNTVSGIPFAVGTAAILNVPVPGTNNLTISFTDASGFNPLHTNYYSINGGSYQYQVTSNPFVVSDLSYAGVYSISMKSMNSAGYRISNTVSGEPRVVGTAPRINSVAPDINRLIVDFNDASGFNPVQATYYSLDGGITYPYLVPSIPTFTIGNLTTATVYYISLKSANNVGYKISNTLSGEPIVTGSPASLTTPVPGTNSLSISFTDASGFNPKQTTYYSTDGGSTYPNTNIVRDSPLILSGLSNRAYSIRFVSFNYAGNLYSNSVSGTPYYTGTAPALNAPVSGTNSLSISFTDASGFNPKQTTYYSTDGGSTYPNTNIVRDSPLVLSGLSNRAYSIIFVSFNYAGNLYSNVVSGTPYYTGTAPVLNTPVSGTNSLSISFTDASGFNPTQTTEYTLDGGVTYTPVPPNLNPFTISNLEKRVYTVQFKSFNNTGTLYSNVVSGTPYYTGTAAQLNLPTPGTNSLSISFTDASGFNPKQTTYYSTDGGSTYPNTNIVRDSPLILSGLSNRAYSIRFVSFNYAGNLYSNVVSSEPYYTGTSPALNTPVSGINSLTISFTDASGFNPKQTTEYTLDGGTTYTTVPPNSNSFTLQNLEKRVYYIKLRSTNIAGSLFSSTLSGEPYYTGTSPALNTPVSGTNSLTISFTDASGFNPKQTTEYTLDGGITYTAVPPNLNPFTISNLEKRVYYIKLRAKNDAGTLFSNEVSGTPYFTGVGPILNPPVSGINSLTISFTDASGFYPQQTTQYTLDGGTTYTTVPPNSNSFTLQNLEKRVYTVQLKSFNVAGTLYSLTLSGEPYFTGTDPILNAPTSGINSLTISFTDASGFYPTQTNYYSLDGGVSYPYLIPSNSNSFTISSLEHRVYYIKLKSTNVAGNTFSSTLSGEPFYAGTAATLSTPVSGIGSLSISFTNAYGFNPLQTTYYLYSTDGGVTYSTPIIVQSNNNPLILQDLSNKTHFFKFKSSNSAGDVYSNIVSGTPYFLGTVPSINKVTSAKNSLIVDFSGSVGGNPAPVTYYSLDGGVTYETTPVTTSPFTINLPAIRAVYYIKLNATNAAGNLFSNTVSGEPYVVGSVPRITGVDPSKNSLIVNFTQSALGYPPNPTYYYSFNGIDISGQGVSSSPITIPNLTLSRYYTFYIIASNAGGNVVSLSASGQPLVVGSAPIINSVTSAPNSLIVDFSQNNPGNPEPTYYYSFDGSYIDFLQNSVKTSPITIPNLTIAQFYTFYIVSINTIGRVVSLSASGKPYVLGRAPTIIDTSNILNGDVVLNGLVLNFNGSAGGNPPPDKNYYSLNGGSFIDSGYTTSPMVIPNLNQPRPYLITIMAHNLMGNTVVSNSIVGTPYIIANPPVIYDISSGINSMSVSFMPAYNGYPEILNYFYSIDGVNYIDAQTTSSPIRIEGLTTYGPYSVTLIASSLAGYTQPSNSFFGKAYVVGEGPIIINVEENYNSLVVAFSNPTAYPAPNKYYYSFNGINYSLSNQTDSTPLYLNQLKTGTLYDISLYSVNTAGESPITTFNAFTLASSSFYASIVNPSYNRNAPIYIGPQPKSATSTSNGTNLTAVSTRGKYSYYVSGTAGSRR